MKHRLASTLIALALLALAIPAGAGVVINGTRVVFPAGDGEVTVQLANTGEAPALVQAWLDSGDPEQTPDTSTAPFVLTPPISRIEPGRGQALRIVHVGEPLPGDRESVFWLNVLEVPPMPETDDDQNYLQVAFRSRIKLFYRPSGLEAPAGQAPGQLRWTRPSPERIRVENPSPYHVTITRLRAGDGAGLIGDAGLMLAPGEARELDAPVDASQVWFSTINDYGGRADHTAAIGR